MKKSIYLLVFVLIGCFSGCGDDNGDDIVNSKIGVHKIVVEIQGDDVVSITASFSGSGSGGYSRLYDEGGTYQGESYVKQGTVKELKKIVCYTDNKCEFLTSVTLVSSVDENTTATYSVKAYINDKLVDEVSKTTSFGKGGVTTDLITLSTVKI
ncbi:hypothetical protein FACS189451_04000 [Bacteroidia bacterium]|nr:hypothetical protein FACS189446_1800 [Bacteroidia bacterium]GHT61605.1 hypothetical protein FACS189451_04000 [Bacteroidia bacterium]